MFVEALFCRSLIALLFKLCQKSVGQDVRGGSMVKKPPADAGDTGSIPDLGGSHVLRSN